MVNTLVSVPFVTCSTTLTIYQIMNRIFSSLRAKYGDTYFVECGQCIGKL